MKRLNVLIRFSGPSHLQEVALANLAQDLERELTHSLANQLKTHAEVERLKEKLTTISVKSYYSKVV